MTIATEEPVVSAPGMAPELAPVPVETIYPAKGEAPIAAEPRGFWGWTGFVFGWIGIVLLLAGYSYFIRTHYIPAISEPDDNGYFAQGTLLAQTGKTWFAAASDAQYIGMHWLITPTATYVSRYPPGLPVLIALVYKLWGAGAAGWRAAAWINPVLSVLTLAGFFMLTRRVLNAWWGLVGVAVLGANPTFIHHALDGDSHMGVAFAVVWGLYMLMVWRDGGKLWQVFIAGLFLGCIPPVRYGDSVMAIGIGMFFLWNWRAFPKIWQHYAMACAGAAIPIIPLLIRNQLVMGRFWRTGYSLTNEETGFSMDYFKEHAIDYVHQINGNAIGVIFALGFAGMFCMIFKSGQRKNRPLGIMLLLMSAGMLLLYMAYYWAPQGNPQSTLRFLLPTYALYILAGLWLLREAAGAKAIVAPAVVGLALVALQIVWGNTEFFQEVDQLHYQHEGLNRVTLALEQKAQPGDVVIATGNLMQHLDFVREWKIADESLLNGAAGGFGGGPPVGAVGPGGGGFAGGGFGGGRGAGGGFGGGGRRGGAGGGFAGGGFGGGGRGGVAADPNAPSPRQADKAIEEREKYSGTVAQRQHKFVTDMITWAGPGHKIYIVGAEASVRAWNGIDNGTLKVIKVVQLPEQPEEPTDGGGFGGGFGGRGGGRGGGLGGGGGRRGGGGGGGGPMGGFAGETEIVIGEFTPHK